MSKALMAWGRGLVLPARVGVDDISFLLSRIYSISKKNRFFVKNKTTSSKNKLIFLLI